MAWVSCECGWYLTGYASRRAALRMHDAHVHRCDNDEAPDSEEPGASSD